MDTETRTVRQIESAMFPLYHNILASQQKAQSNTSKQELTPGQATLEQTLMSIGLSPDEEGRYFVFYDDGRRTSPFYSYLEGRGTYLDKTQELPWAVLTRCAKKTNPSQQPDLFYFVAGCYLHVLLEASRRKGCGEVGQNLTYPEQDHLITLMQKMGELPDECFTKEDEKKKCRWSGMARGKHTANVIKTLTSAFLKTHPADRESWKNRTSPLRKAWKNCDYGLRQRPEGYRKPHLLFTFS